MFVRDNNNQTIFLLIILFLFTTGSSTIAEQEFTGPASVLSQVRGTVLLKVENSEALGADLREILLGNDSVLKKKKLITVEGLNDGNEIQLQGTGPVGEEYEFTLSTGPETCGSSPITRGKLIRETHPFPSPFTIAFNSRSVEIEPDGGQRDTYRCFGAFGMATLKASFHEIENGTPLLSGRFNLRFSNPEGGFGGFPGSGSTSGILPGSSPNESDNSSGSKDNDGTNGEETTIANINNSCVSFPPDQPTSSDPDDGALDRFLEEPNLINVKIENLPSKVQHLLDPKKKSQLLGVIVKLKINTEVINLGIEETSGYYIAGVDPFNYPAVLVTKDVLASGFSINPTLGIPPCITFSIRPLGRGVGSSEVIVEEILDQITNKPVKGANITQSAKEVNVKCIDPDGCS